MAMGDSAAGHFTYAIFGTDQPFIHEDQWAVLRRMFKEEPATEAFESARTFGLEGQLEMELEDGVLKWGGPLLDLATGLAEWLAVPPEVFTLLPAEQAPSLTIRTEDATCTFLVAGIDQGRLGLEHARATIDGFLRALARDIRDRVPLADIPVEFWWILDRHEGG